MATKRAERKAAEDAADDTERQRRSEEEARHKADYKAVERQALEVEVEIKKKEMAVLSRIMSHQG